MNKTGKQLKINIKYGWPLASVAANHRKEQTMDREQYIDFWLKVIEADRQNVKEGFNSIFTSLYEEEEAEDE